MMAAGLGVDQAKTRIGDLGLDGKIRVACVNSPESVTISGDVDAIDAFKASLDQAGVFARVLKTDGKAYHSHHMAAIGKEYEDLLAAALAQQKSSSSLPLSAKAQFTSSVTGKVMTAPANASYWRQNLQSPVLFSTVVEKIIRAQAVHMVEIGPHSALELPIKQTRLKLNISDGKVHYGSALSRGKNSVQTLLGLVGDLYLHGHDVSFASINTAAAAGAAVQGQLVRDMPRYSWDYSHVVFNEPRVSAEWRNRKYPRHDILGSQVPGGNAVMHSWRNVLSIKDVPWLEGHKLEDTVVFPGAGYIAMAVEAVSQVADAMADAERVVQLRDVVISKALVLPSTESGSAGVEIFTTLSPVKALAATADTAMAWHEFQVSSYSEGEAVVHARGLIQLDVSAEYRSLPLDVDPTALENSAPRTWYNKFNKTGLNFQDQFQSLTEIQTSRSRQQMHVMGKTQPRQGGASSSSGGVLESEYLVHPIAIDSLFQAGIIANTAGVVRDLRSKVPVHVGDITIRGVAKSTTTTTTPWAVKAVSEPVGMGSISVSAELYDEKSGHTLVQLSKSRLVAYQSGLQDAADERHPMLRVVWKPDIQNLGPNNSRELSRYIQEYTRAATAATAATVTTSPRSLGELGAVLDLLTHKTSRLRILAFSATMDESLAEMLQLQSSYRKCQACWSAYPQEDGSLRFVDLILNKPIVSRPADDAGFDLIIVGSRPLNIDTVVALGAENNVVLMAGAGADATALEAAGYATIQASGVILARRYKTIDAPKAAKPVLIVSASYLST